MKEKIINKLTSRKFWMAFATLISGIILMFGGSENTQNTAYGVLLSLGSCVGYLIGEGLCDSKNATSDEAENEETDA